MPGSFFDTNVLAYLVSEDTGKAKAAEAAAVAGGTISVQVLNELANVARRKLRMPWHETRQFLGVVRKLVTVVPVTVAIHESGLKLAERYGLALYDAMIAAAALDCACDTLWSEDMDHGLLIGGTLRVVNPFLLPPSPPGV
jgi:predicted nucleic acid-binding protein